MNIAQLIATELGLKPDQIENTLELLAQGATIPFIARYRKEKTSSLNETQLRAIESRHNYLTELQERKTVILNAIATQDKLTPQLEQKINQTLLKTELEDLYLPYKPKRRTRATIAKEKGLEPLANFIQSLNHPSAKPISLKPEATKYIPDNITLELALQGASDILAEQISEIAELKKYIREYIYQSGSFVANISSTHPEGTTKYEMYRKYSIPIKKIAPHNLLALYRGQGEGIIELDIVFDIDHAISYIQSTQNLSSIPEVRTFYQEMLTDAFMRLMKNSILTEIKNQVKEASDQASLITFESNLKNLLLSAPAGMKPTLGIDPGFRTGCKVAVLSQTGQLLEYITIYPHQDNQKQNATQTIKHLISIYKIELIAIGNGTGSRETDQFISEIIKTLDQKPIKIIVNESGASIYSASEVAIAEFPDLDVTIRGAISIGRRLQDPLAELVKIDPKSIGVGQYQHDVDQKLLKQKLNQTVESCVNYVGVDLNTASKELLTYVAGMNATIAKNIITYRNQNGVFRNRSELLSVPKLGPKTFEQAAGFLRIRNGDHPLDNTGVHPESYSIVEKIASDLGVNLAEISKANLKKINLKKYITDQIGEPTLRDIIQELEKPGRDPRAEFKYATFQPEITEISDLKIGMELEGTITNVANFGAFVDIGVHQDGLIHISQLADRFVSNPNEIVKVGQVVKVRVIEVDIKLKRISLSMKTR